MESRNGCHAAVLYVDHIADGAQVLAHLVTIPALVGSVTVGAPTAPFLIVFNGGQAGATSIN